MLNTILSRLFHRPVTFVPGTLPDGQPPAGRALLYYKTDSLVRPSLAEQYRHTNDWEVLEIVRVLTSLGLQTDVLDRNFDPAKFLPDDVYDLFIGLGAGNSGKHFSLLAKRLTRATKVFFAAGPYPPLSNRLIHERYAYFEERHPGTKLKLRRMIDKVDINAALANTDAIFAVGNSFSVGSYQPYGKPIHVIYPSSSPTLGLSTDALDSRSPRSFVYFGGNGHVVKGLDLLIEVFSGLPDLHLDVCAPADEEDFNDFYRETLNRSPNIQQHGFVAVGGATFNEIAARCAYVVLPSCSEGIATSVATCMRVGMIPIVTREAGIDTGDFGFLLDDVKLETIRAAIVRAAGIESSDVRRRAQAAFSASERYTQKGFSESFRNAVINVMGPRISTSTAERGHQ